MPRMNYAEKAPDLVKALMEFGALAHKSTLGATILDLVNIRASQLNGCAFCLDMHVKEAKIHGERELRLYHIPIWRESALFSEKERACLEWTELVTKLPEHGISDESYQEVRKHLDEKELAELSFAIGIINMWNRLNACFRNEPGSLDKMLGLTKAGLN